MDGSAPAEDLDRLTAELQLWEEAARDLPQDHPGPHQG